MEAYEKPLASVIAAILVAIAGYFIWQQCLTVRKLDGNIHVPSDQRRYLLKQVGRRLFGSFLMMFLAVLLIGSLFLEDPTQLVDPNALDPVPDKQTTRFNLLYWMTTLLVLMVVLALGVFDLWATARFGFQQQKQLALEHQETLREELARLRHRRSELN